MVLIKEFVKGFLENATNNYELIYMYSISNDELKQNFFDTENILYAFPLYFNAMPSRVKDFFEYLELNVCKPYKRKIGFLIQFGFPEAVNAKALINYLERYVRKSGNSYLGSLVLGRCEGIDKEACFFNRKGLRGMYLMGRSFGQRGEFNTQLIKKYIGTKDNFNFGIDILNKIFVSYINRFHWDKLLRKNGTIKQSFCKPYA